MVDRPVPGAVTLAATPPELEQTALPSPIARLRALLGLGSVAAGAFLEFSTVWLVTRGLTPDQIGVVAAIMAAGVALAAASYGRLVDARLGIERGIGLMFTVAFGCLGLAIGAPTLPLGVLGVIGHWVAVAAAMPLFDAFAVTALRNPGREFGSVRFVGSLAFAMTVAICGSVYQAVGFWPALVVFGAAAVACMVVLRGFAPAAGRTEAPNGTGIEATASTAARLSSVERGVPVRIWRWPVIVALVAIIITHVGLEGGYTFVNVRLLELGGTTGQVGIAVALGALGQILAMVLVGRYIGRLGVGVVFGLSVAIYAAVIATWGIATTPEVIVASRLVSGIGVGGFTVAGILGMSRLFPAAQRATAQGLYQSSAYGVAAVVGTILAGALYAQVGASTMFLLAACTTFAGGVLGAIVLGRWRAPGGATP